MTESPCKTCKEVVKRCKGSGAWCNKWGDWFAVEWRAAVAVLTGEPAKPLGREMYGYRAVAKRGDGGGGGGKG